MTIDDFAKRLDEFYGPGSIVPVDMPTTQSMATLLGEVARRIDSLQAQVEVLKSALEPFSDAWCVIADRAELFRHLSLGQIGALAAREISGVHFKNARAALTQVQQFSDGERK